MKGKSQQLPPPQQAANEDDQSPVDPNDKSKPIVVETDVKKMGCWGKIQN